MRAPCGCKSGTFLCKEAEYLWARTGVAYFARAYTEQDEWRDKYSAHMSIVKGREAAKS